MAGYKPNLPVANGILLPVRDEDTAQDLAVVGRLLESALASDPAPADLGAIVGRTLADYLGADHSIL